MCEYLCGEIGEDKLEIEPKFETGIEGVLDWWKPKAIKRYSKLLNDEKIESDTLWYDELDENLVESWMVANGIPTELVRSLV